METVIQTPAINIDALADYQQEAMCRTIIGSIRRLFEDERNRADFEQWKAGRGAKQSNRK